MAYALKMLTQKQKKMKENPLSFAEELVCELKKGNGNHFTVKEIIQSNTHLLNNHIEKSLEFQTKALEMLTDLKVKHTKNATSIFYLKLFVLGLFSSVGLLFSLII